MAKMKKCPACAEEVQSAALKCKHCGEVLPTADSAESPKSSLVSFLVLLIVIIMVGQVFGEDPPSDAEAAAIRQQQDAEDHREDIAEKQQATEEKSRIDNASMAEKLAMIGGRSGDKKAILSFQSSLDKMRSAYPGSGEQKFADMGVASFQKLEKEERNLPSFDAYMVRAAGFLANKPAGTPEEAFALYMVTYQR